MENYHKKDWWNKMNIKMSKLFMRFGKSVGRYMTHNEKKKNSDPELFKYIRPSRRSKNLIDSYTNTKWLKRIYDKSWKNRCKKRHQYCKHKKSLYELRIINKKIKEKEDIILKMSSKEKNDYELMKSIIGEELFDETIDSLIISGRLCLYWDYCEDSKCRKAFYKLI